MATIKIPIDGKSISLKHKHLDINLLDLDQENPRIGLYRDNQPSGKSLSDAEVKFAITAKSPDSYAKLKDAIHYNKGIIQPIWLEPIEDGRFRVIEGNTRLLIYRELAKQEPLEKQWQTIYSVELPKGIKEEDKNFVRLWAHLRGTNDWDAYEKAKYLYRLSAEDYWPLTKIERQTKLKKRVIEQNIEAFKLMQELYLPSRMDDPSEVSKFSYFVEYIKDKKLKAIMHSRSLGDTDFCNWVGDKTKLPTGQNVRQLRDILADDASSQLFIDKGFESAFSLLSFKKPDLVDPLYKNIEKVIEDLKNLSASEMTDIANEAESGKEKLINDLAHWSAQIANYIENNKEDEY
jgi:hypothetical protein